LLVASAKFSAINRGNQPVNNGKTNLDQTLGESRILNLEHTLKNHFAPKEDVSKLLSLLFFVILIRRGGSESSLKTNRVPSLCSG